VDRLFATKSEDVGIIVCVISLWDFQPIWSQSTNVTDRQTDGRTTCDPKTALSTVRIRKSVPYHDPAPGRIATTTILLCWRSAEVCALLSTSSCKCKGPETLQPCVLWAYKWYNAAKCDCGRTPIRNMINTAQCYGRRCIVTRLRLWALWKYTPGIRCFRRQTRPISTQSIHPFSPIRVTAVSIARWSSNRSSVAW